jgi:predicted TIM-barrel fold metal-dependent hydrolase
MNYFDCNCMIGKRADRREGEPWSVDSLLQDMEYFGISEALVTHALSKDYDPIEGNKEIIRTLQGHENLHPVWAIVPPATPEIPSSTEFIREARRNGVWAFTAFPKLHNFSLSEWSVGDLLTEAQHAGIPLLLPFSETSWDEVNSICCAYAELPVIIHTVNYRQLRFLLPLWQKHRNLYVDLSWFSMVDILPFLTHNNLAGRLVFGTNYPIYTPGAAITMVSYADSTSEIKKMIAGDNLRKAYHNHTTTL